MSELPLARQGPSGALTEECQAELRDAMAEAAKAEDFRTASQLKTMLDVLGPPSRTQIRDTVSPMISNNSGVPVLNSGRRRSARGAALERLQF
eukprot:SAG31_NODE_25136_length_467_cov_0.932065_1_plen_93_part_00